MEITEKIRESIDSSTLCCGIFIDLRKAFDTVNHDITYISTFKKTRILWGQRSSSGMVQDLI